MPSKKQKKKSLKKSVKKSVQKTTKETDENSKSSVLNKYDIILRTHERRNVLLEDAKHFGTLKILKQLNLMRDYNQWNPRAHEIMTKDLEFLEKNYQKERKQ